MPDTDQEIVDRFFLEAAGWWQSYTYQAFSFFGVKNGDLVKVVLGRVRLQPGVSPRGRIHQFGQFIGGILPLAPRKSAAKALVNELLSGQESGPIEGLRFILPASRDCGLHTLPPTRYHPEGMSNGRRLSVLPILGGYRPEEVQAEQIDWLLRASKNPYDGLAELLAELSLPIQVGQRCSIDVIAANVVEVLAASAVADDKATIGLWLRRPTRRSSARLTFRVTHKGQVVQRGAFAGSELSWTSDGDVWTGTKDLSVPSGAIVQCFAVYAGQVHHFSWAADPTCFPNPRLAAFETVDTSLQVLKKYLQPSANKGGASQQFEAAVSWLFWACGLAPAHLALADEAKDGPDILAVAPGGAIAVIECTIGLLKADSKLAKVIRRALTVRESLARAGFPNLNVLPVIVTALPRDQVKSEQDAATEAGVLVLAKENLQNMLDQAKGLVLNGDATFKRGMDSLADAQSDLQRRKDAALHQGGLVQPLAP